MPEESSLRELVEQLSNTALRDLLRNVRHHTELRRRTAAGLVDEREVNRAYREYARREGAAYRQQAADLTLRYYSELTDLGNTYSERFYAELLDADDSRVDGNGFGAPEEASREEGSDEVVHVELHGPPGREVVARFGLENSEDHGVTLTIEVGACRGPDDAAFIAPLTVQPAELELEPGESRQVTLRLAMLPSVFVPGHLYRVPVTVRGAEELQLLLTIWSEERDNGWPVDASPPEESDPARNDGESATTDESGLYLVRCPACKRSFERRTRTSRLYPHKTSAGDPCPERKGRVRAAR